MSMETCGLDARCAGCIRRSDEQMEAAVADDVSNHYGGGNDLAGAIADSLRRAGKDMDRLTTADLATVDEFHIRARKATLELAQSLNLDAASRVLDIGSGLGGPARTLAETFGCHVTGIDITQAFCDAATALSSWVGLSDRVDFRQGDATSLPFDDAVFDAAMTIHVAMNIAAKDRMYAEARRVLKPGSRFVAAHGVEMPADNRAAHQHPGREAQRQEDKQRNPPRRAKHAEGLVVHVDLA